MAAVHRQASAEPVTLSEAGFVTCLLMSFKLGRPARDLCSATSGLPSSSAQFFSN